MAASMPSSDVPDISPSAQIGLHAAISIIRFPFSPFADNPVSRLGGYPMSYQPKSEFLQVMQARGFIQDCTDMQGLDEALQAGNVPGYIGFDATATSLHVGSLIQIMMLRWLQKTGHQPIVLMGGGTSKIGDPSFRDEQRGLMSDEVIARNIQGIAQVFGRYVDFDKGALMVDNADWLDGLAYIPFLREVGRYFSVNRMLSFESVRSEEHTSELQVTWPSRMPSSA